MTRDEFIKEIVDGMGSGDLEEFLEELHSRFFTNVDGNCTIDSVENPFTYEDVEKFANMLADWVMGPR